MPQVNLAELQQKIDATLLNLQVMFTRRKKQGLHLPSDESERLFSLLKTSSEVIGGLARRLVTQEEALDLMYVRVGKAIEAVNQLTGEGDDDSCDSLD